VGPNGLELSGIDLDGYPRTAVDLLDCVLENALHHVGVGTQLGVDDLAGDLQAQRHHLGFGLPEYLVVQLGGAVDDSSDLLDHLRGLLLAGRSPG
jgi:hypothetical protein